MKRRELWNHEARSPLETLVSAAADQVGASLVIHSIRDRLRAATRQEHAALDAAVGDWRLDGASDYGLFLRASASALGPLELALEAAGVEAWLPDWPERTRRAALKADLAALDLEPPPGEPAWVTGPAFGAGVLYVLEGSRLGSKVLSRRAAANPDLPRAYLDHGQGPSLWRSFLEWLEGRAYVAFPTDDIVEGARYGFRRFSASFETCPGLEAPLGA